MNILLLIIGVVVYGASFVWLTKSSKYKLAKAKQAIAQRHEQELDLQQQHIQALEQQLHQQTEKYRADITQLQQEHQSLTDSWHQTQAELHQSQSSREVLSQELLDCHSELDRIHQDHQRLLGEFQGQETGLKQLQQETQTLTKTLEENQGAIAQLMTELVQKDGQLQSLHGDITTYQSEQQLLQKQLQSKTDEYNELDQYFDEELKKVSSQRDTYKKELQKLKYSSRHEWHEDGKEKNKALDPTQVEVARIIEIIESGMDSNPFKQHLMLVLSQIFSNLYFLRDSVDEIVDIYNQKDREKFSSLIETLYFINENHINELRERKKIRATKRKWSECRVPHIDLLRIYFQKLKYPEKKYQILISPKQDEKTQNRDFEWLKNNTVY